MSEHRTTAWWRDAVIYEVYVRSFADHNGDGVGDLLGIRDRLDHLRDLGVDALWITPFYASPMADGGYDVANYRDVDPLFGSLNDFDELLTRAHELDLRVIVDIVPNHTSSQHPWFIEAHNGPPDGDARSRYIFRPGRGANGELPPTNWESVFGGPAWTRITEPNGKPGEWYLHLFAAEQPDLNWEHPQVRDEFQAILRFWLDRGVDGFRIDVAHGLVKDPLHPDVQRDAHTGLLASDVVPYFDQDGVHDIYQAWRKILDSYPGERIAVAEAWVANPGRLARYVRPDELHQAFNFEFIKAKWDAHAMRSVIDASLTAAAAVGAPTTWVLSNHDVVRHVTRYGGGELGLRRARAGTLLMLALPGSAYLYQGEELGLPEVVDLPNEVLQDPVWERSGYTRRGRDGARVPMPWEGEEPPFGFSEPGVETWLPMPAEWHDLTVEAQAGDPYSTYSLYRTALRIRREHPALGDGDMSWLHSPDDVLLFQREPGFVCATNIGAQSATVRQEGRLLIASGPDDYDGTTLVLPGDTTAWIAR